MRRGNKIMRLAAAALALTLTLAGCGGRPQGVLAPVEARAQNATLVSMLVATMRAPSADSGRLFTGERAERASFADITVSVPPDSARQIGEVQWPSSVPGNPETDFVVASAERISFLESARRFRERLRRVPSRRVMVFVHGFNTRFEEAVFRFAQIVKDANAPVEPVLFTWPSRGQLLAYGYDRESANYSRDSLERLLTELTQSSDVREVVILAHSMGNWVTMEALRQMAIRNGRVHPKITQALLAAPDVDVDVFQRQIAAIGEKRPAFTLFVSAEDRALSFSQTLQGGVQRLGAIDPNAEPWRSKLENGKVAVVDLAKTRSSDPLGHTTFAASPDVVRSIGARLVAGQALGETRGGVGSALAGGASRIVGGAAEAIVSAPFALIDDGARERLGAAVPGAEEGQSEGAAPEIARPECKTRRAAGKLGC
jgi:esterase/lipase superfamily enzyme